jgi:hypothetical protein
MRLVITLLLLSVFLISCSDDNSAPPDNFFNLQTGNLWVYKRFNSGDGINYVASARIDSVSVTGTSEIAGLTYSTLLHKVYYNGASPELTEEHVREDDGGHLVNSSGYVLHPGNDASFTNTRAIVVGNETLGNINYHLNAPMNVTVEGEQYYIYPYIGDYVPLDPANDAQYIFDYYQEGLGLVNQHCSAVNGPSCYEDRLIYHELN